MLPRTMDSFPEVVCLGHTDGQRQTETDRDRQRRTARDRDIDPKKGREGWHSADSSFTGIPFQPSLFSVGEKIPNHLLNHYSYRFQFLWIYSFTVTGFLVLDIFLYSYRVGFLC